MPAPSYNTARPAMTGRFKDSWVVDRVMFEYVNQGGCSCCGMSHIGMDLNTFMQMCSDVETDDGRKEKRSPWPEFIQHEVWRDRVKLRQQLKQTMSEVRMHVCLWVWVMVSSQQPRES